MSGDRPVESEINDELNPDAPNEPKDHSKVVTTEKILETGMETAEHIGLWFESKKIELDAKKIAVISDVHSNFVALEAILKDMKAREFDTIICLGDLVGYYTEPDEVISEIKKLSSVTVMGNHDFTLIEPEELLYATLQEAAQKAMDHNKGVVSEDNKAWIKNLPLKVILTTPSADLTLVHGDPVTIFGYIYGTTDKLFEKSIKHALKHTNTKYLLVGHSHLQGEYYANDGKIYLNPGSVGQPRDGDPRAAYAIMDLEAKTNELIRVKYDIEKVSKQVIQCCLPEYLATRLAVGE